jgi:hypothetical protein
MMPYSVVYRLKPTPCNSNPQLYKMNVPPEYIKTYGQSPLAAERYALECFSLNAIDYLAINDLSGELSIIKC